MRFFLSAFGLSLRRLVRRPATLACLLLAPLITLALGLALPATAGDDAITVGVLLPNDARAQDLWQNLETYSDADVRFVTAEDRAQLEAMVGAGAWECGYAAAEDFATRLDQGRTARLMTRVDSPATTLGAMVDWMVAASLLDVYAPDIALGYVADTLPEASGPAQQSGEIEAAANAAFATDYMMRLEVVPTGAAAAGTAAQTGAALVRGLVALLLFLFSCLCAIAFTGDLSSGFFLRLGPLAGRARLYFPAFAASAVLAAAAGGLCLFFAGLCFPGAFAAPWQEALWLGLYLVYLAAFSWFLAAVFPRREALVGALPFLLIACLLLCPIVFDLTQYLPVARWPALALPPTLYLRAAAGQSAPLWQLPAAAAALALLGALADRIRRGGSARAKTALKTPL